MQANEPHGWLWTSLESSAPPSCAHGLAQEGNADRLFLERHTEEEKRADLIGQVLGWRKVGWIFAQSTQERDFIMSVEEVCQMAGVQLEMAPQAVTGVVSMSPEGDVHFEAFQVKPLPRARSTTLSLRLHSSGDGPQCRRRPFLCHHPLPTWLHARVALALLSS